jgi:hypothetical protein
MGRKAGDAIKTSVGGANRTRTSVTVGSLMRRMVVAERKGLANEKVHHQFELGPGANQATAEYKRIAVMPFYR